MKPIALALFLALSPVAVTTAQAQKAPVYTGILSNTAVGGYDPVTFFDGESQPGQASITTDYNGATWRFISEDNKARFEADPAAFAPQYGGYCAWAVGQGYLAKGDPRYATVVAGKLYLNFNAEVQEKWSADIPGHISRANGNWPGILSN